MGDVKGKLIKALARQYALPKGAEADIEAWSSDYVRILQSFDDETLAKAADFITKTRLARSFPLPAECNLACAEAVKGEAIRARQDRPDNRGERISAFAKSESLERAIKRADELFAAFPLSRAALDEGWWWRLHSWIVKEQRLPDVHEIQRIKVDAAHNNRMLVENLENNPLGRKLSEWETRACDRLTELTKAA